MSMPIIGKAECPISRDQAITDLIESIALEQAALSHIINAEGEKIQKILKIFECTDEIFKVNDSVKGVLDAVTRLEDLLVAKLELISCKICRYDDHEC